MFLSVSFLVSRFNTISSFHGIVWNSTCERQCERNCKRDHLNLIANFLSTTRFRFHGIIFMTFHVVATGIRFLRISYEFPFVFVNSSRYWKRRSKRSTVVPIETYLRDQLFAFIWLHGQWTHNRDDPRRKNE